MLVGVFFHAALSFMVTPYPWAIKDQSQHLVADVAVWALHGFRMQVFFLIAGFFARMLYTRYGFVGFVSHRLRRIGLPFLLGLLSIVPLIHCVWVYGSVRSSGLDGPTAVWQAVADYFARGAFFQYLAPAHLWFLNYLLWLYAAALLCSAAAVRAGARLGLRSVARLSDRFVAGIVRSVWKPAVLAVPTMLLLLQMKSVWSVDDPAFSFVPNVSVLGYYGIFFGLGWLLQRQPSLLPAFRRGKWTYLGLAALFAVGLPTLVFGVPDLSDLFLRVLDLGPGGYAARIPAWLSVLGVAWLMGMYTWSMVCGVVGVCLHYCSRPHAIIRYVSDAAYWVYLAHLPLVAFLQVSLAHYPLHGLVKYLLINVIALSVLFASYHFGVRPTLVGVLLNGKRA